MKTRFVIVVAVLCSIMLLASVIFTIRLKPSFEDSYYSRLLIDAIREENCSEVEEILAKRPACVNAPHSIIPVGLHAFITERRLNYPLIEACATANVEIINMLIETGANVNINNGFTPLSIIYRSKTDNWYNISLNLIKKGASLNYTTEYTGEKIAVLEDIVYSPPEALLLCYEPDNEEVIKAFNYALENCDHSNVNWMRVLQHSVSNDRIEIVKLLLDQKYCDVNDTSGGKTALMFAARDSTLEMVQLLLDYGADKNYESSDGKTAYDYAVQSGNKDMYSMLEN